MKKSDLYKQQREALEAEIEMLVSKAERSVEDDSKFDDLRARVSELETKITRELEIEAFAAKRAVSAPTIITDRKTVQDYSFRKAIFETAYRGGMTGLEKEMHDEAIRENPGFQGIGIPTMVINSRAALASTSTAVIPTDTRDFIDSLKAKLVIMQAGARMLTGLQGNIYIPRLTSGAATWATEVAGSTDHAASFDAVTMSPKRLSTYQTLSKQLLIQSTYDVENIIRQDMLNAIAIKLDDAAIEGGAAATPTGILGTSGIGSVACGTTGGAPTWQNIVDLEKEVAIDNADIGALAFITNPQVRAKLKATAVGTDQRMVWGVNENTLMGYPTYVTTQCPSDLTKTTTGLSAVIFGNFNDLLVGQWGGWDVIVDPYGTNASQAQVSIYVHSFWDVAVRHAQSFAAIKDAYLS